MTKRKQIENYLDKKPRASATAIAKATGIALSTVNYHLDRIERNIPERTRYETGMILTVKKSNKLPGITMQTTEEKEAQEQAIAEFKAQRKKRVMRNEFNQECEVW